MKHYPSKPRAGIRSRAVRQQRGFTLIELMVAVLVSLFMLAAVLSNYLNMRATFNAQDGLSRLQDSQRLVLSMMTTTTQAAGFFVNPLVDTLASALPASQVSWPAGGSSTFIAGQSVVGTGNGSGSGTASDAFAVRYQTAGGDGLMNCQGGANTGATPIVWVNVFSIDAKNTLTCSVNGAAPVTLVDNVTRLSVVYGVDTDGDGSNDAYLPASAITAANLWGRLHTLQVTIGFLDPLADPTTTTTVPNQIVYSIDLKNAL